VQSYGVDDARNGDEVSLSDRDRILLVELCRPLLKGGTAPASAQDLGDLFHVATGRVRQILNRLCARFTIADGAGEARCERLAREVMRHGLVCETDFNG
jgi:hypothetical protein